MYGLLSGLREYFTRIMKGRSRGKSSSIIIHNIFLVGMNLRKNFKFLDLFPVCAQLRVRKYDLTYVMFKYFPLLGLPILLN